MNQRELELCRRLITTAEPNLARDALLKVSDWLRGAEQEAALVAALDAHPRVRRQAVELLAHLQSEAALPALRQMAADSDDHRRQSATRLLGVLLSERGVPILLDLLGDARPSIRADAKASLDAIRFYHEEKAHWDRVFSGTAQSPASAAAALLDRAKPDRDRATRLMAIRSLGSLGVAETLPFLIDYADDADEEIKQAAIDAVQRINRKHGAK